MTTQSERKTPIRNALEQIRTQMGVDEKIWFVGWEHRSTTSSPPRYLWWPISTADSPQKNTGGKANVVATTLFTLGVEIWMPDAEALLLHYMALRGAVEIEHGSPDVTFGRGAFSRPEKTSHGVTLVVPLTFRLDNLAKIIPDIGLTADDPRLTTIQATEAQVTKTGAVTGDPWLELGDE